MMPKSAEEMGLAAFAPAEGSKAIQTPYGSLQLANGSLQQSFGTANMSPMVGLGGTLVPEESEEDDEEDDDDEDENGNKKRKRAGKGLQQKKSSNNIAAGAAGGGGRASGGANAAAAGERDTHTGRRKIRIEFIEDDSRRHITFSKRKAGIMKKAYELATLTGTQVLLLIVSQTGLVYTFTTPKLSPVVQQPAGRELIQSCLNAPEPQEMAGGVEDDVQNLRPNSADQQRLEPSVTSNSHSGMSNSSNDHLNNVVAQHLAATSHQNNPSVYSTASNTGFSHDPRQQAALLGLSMPGMSMGLPAHMHGMGGAYGYTAGLQQLVGHDSAIAYGTYGGM